MRDCSLQPCGDSAVSMVDRPSWRWVADVVDTDGFDAFYQGTSQRLARYAYGLTGNATDAQDLAQEAYARAWQHWRTVRECDEPEAWLRVVLTRLATDRWRRYRVHRAASARRATALRRQPLGHSCGSQNHHGAVPRSNGTRRVCSPQRRPMTRMSIQYISLPRNRHVVGGRQITVPSAWRSSGPVS